MAGEAGMRQSDRAGHSAALKPGGSVAGGAGCDSHAWGVVPWRVLSAHQRSCGNSVDLEIFKVS